MVVVDGPVGGFELADGTGGLSVFNESGSSIALSIGQYVKIIDIGNTMTVRVLDSPPEQNFKSIYKSLVDRITNLEEQLANVNTILEQINGNSDSES